MENSGDSFIGLSTEKHPLTYWECLYFLVVTMSTVGYGDISPNTVLGRLFIAIFICASIVSISFIFNILKSLEITVLLMLVEGGKQ